MKNRIKICSIKIKKYMENKIKILDNLNFFLCRCLIPDDLLEWKLYNYDVRKFFRRKECMIY